MPPEKARQQPDEAGARPGRRLDPRPPPARGGAKRGRPGPVLARRLSNAEYDYTVRDLTGVDIRPTREFPVDPANEAGFDNSGESLVMSPALLKKYLDAARAVADHAGAGAPGAGLRPLPGRHRHRSRPLRRRAHRRLLRSGSPPTWPATSWPPGASSTGPRSASRRPPWRAAAAEEQVSRRLPAHGLVGAGRGAARRSGPLARLQAMFRALPAPAAAEAAPGRLRERCATS